MGLISGMLKAGIAKKAYDVARKPENQRKVKDLLARARSKKDAKR